VVKRCDSGGWDHRVGRNREEDPTVHHRSTTNTEIGTETRE